MPETLIGDARCSTDDQDLIAQQQRLTELGVPPDRIYLDHGLTGTDRARPYLDHGEFDGTHNESYLKGLPLQRIDSGEVLVAYE